MKLDRRFLLLLLCFVLSGAAGLTYQTAWTQQFAFVFGTSELALVTVLAAYMAGLALGAMVAARCEHRVRRPVAVYAVLELGIGAAALTVPAAVTLAGKVHAALAGGADTVPDAASTGAALFYVVSSFVILLIPTAMMGATLPLLVRHAVTREAEIGSRVGLLYSANTAGAAAGTLVTAFLLLPALGLGQTILAGAAVNLLVFVLAVLLVSGAGPREARPRPAPSSSGRRFHWILPVMLVSGAVSFTYEVLWTRLLSHLVGGSVYAFAVMLATFLTGIALGAAVASRLATGPERARRWFAATQATVALTSLAAFHAVDRLPELLDALGEQSLAAGAAASAAVLLPMTVAIGATFPFAVRVLAREAAAAAAASARVFAWNTAGAIAGALLAGYFVLPALRFEGTAVVAAGVSLILAAGTALAARPRWTPLAAAASAGLLLLVFWRPPAPWTVLRHSPLGSSEFRGEVAFYEVGKSATVLLFAHPTAWQLTTNGLPESSIERAGIRPGRLGIARWLSLLPVAVRPEARSLLVVGLGAGVTVEDVPTSIESIDVVELEPQVVRANREMGGRRRKDPLADPRTTVTVNDARGALRLTARRFDAIVSQPSHPWTAGASHLFTREFVSLVRQRLTDDGVFVQWMGLPFVDESLLRSLVATAVDVFPHVEVYEPAAGGVLILGSGEPLDIAATAGRTLAAAQAEWAPLGFFCLEDFLAARVLDSEGARRFAAGATVSTDHRNLMRTASPRVLRRPLGAAGADRLFAPHDPLFAALEGEVDRLYLVRRLIRSGKVRRARRLAEALPDLVERSTGIGLTELAAGRSQRAAEELNRALDFDSGFDEALFALLSIYEPAVARGQPVTTLPPRLQEAFLYRLRQGPATAVFEGWRLEAAGDWRGVRRLEDRFAAVGPRHPFFIAATRLRAGWRVASGDVEQAREALELVDRMLSSSRSRDLLLRARAAAASGEPHIALASVEEALAWRRSQPAVARAARGVLESLPEDELPDWRRRILARLDDLSRRAGSTDR